MTTLNLQVGFSEDDAYEQSSSVVSITVTNPISDRNDELLGNRWRNVTIAPGSTINSAVISLCILDSANDEPAHRFWFEAADNAAAFAAADSDISNRVLTTAFVDWSSTDLGSGTNQFFSPPDVSAPVQEVIDRPGWASGNSLASICTQPATDGTRDLGVAQFDASSANAAKLDITYTAGGGAVSTHLLAAAAAQRRTSRRIIGVRKVSR